MTEISIAGAIPNPSIVLPTGKAALPIKGPRKNKIAVLGPIQTDGA